MKIVKQCSTCLYWEQIYSYTGDIKHVSGLCSWAYSTITPMWLNLDDALLTPTTLGGAGLECESFFPSPTCEKEDET